MKVTGRLQLRRWQFANCTFDESKWMLTVGGRRVTVEAKPLELLRQLLIMNGDLVTKDDLLDHIWPDIHVVEASLTTAVYKLRQAIGDDKRERQIIQTVSGIGYRMGVPVRCEFLSSPIQATEVLTPAVSASNTASVISTTAAPKRATVLSRLVAIAGGTGVATAALGIVYGPFDRPDVPVPVPPVSLQEARYALRNLDTARVEKMLSNGWNANTRFDTVGTTPLTYVIQICEWDRAHDQRKMLMMTRTLIDAGADIDDRNVFGDTAYSIAKAERYCGPDHPVTQMLEAMCYGGELAPKDLCLATYELTADQRKTQGLPQKSALAVQRPRRSRRPIRTRNSDRMPPR